MSPTDESEFGDVDFELTYRVDGKEAKISGRAQAKLITQNDYEPVYRDGYLDAIKYVRTGQGARITLDCIPGPYLYKIKITEDKAMEKVTTTRTVKVSDYTFASVADARKKAGAPKSATFEFKEVPSEDYSMRGIKVVVFSWDELV